MSNIIREYLNTDDIIEIRSSDSNTRKDNLAQKLANLPRVEVSYNLGQTESPSIKGIGTHRNLSTDVKSNCNLNEQYQTVKIENVGGGCFDKDNLPEITSLDELLNALCEVMIRFDTAPSNYLKDDYTFVIKTLSNALIHLYMNGDDFNYELLSNLPSINDILIKGNVSLDDLSLYSQDEVNEMVDDINGQVGEQLSHKQDKLIAGNNITINNNVISTPDEEDPHFNQWTLDNQIILTTLLQESVKNPSNKYLNALRQWVELPTIAHAALDYPNEDPNYQHLTEKEKSLISSTADTVSEHTEDIADLQTQKADKSITLSGYGITDAYTKTEIDNKISAVFRYKGSVSTYVDLIALTGMVVGDVYNVIETGDNYAWTGTLWDKLSGEIDLSAYLTITSASSTYATITNVNLLTNTVSENTEDIADLQANVDNKQDKNKVITDVVVNNFISSSVYTEYPYEASIEIPGVLSTHLGEVTYNLVDALSTNFAPICETYNGGIKIFSKTNSPITIKTIIIFL